MRAHTCGVAHRCDFILGGGLQSIHPKGEPGFKAERHQEGNLLPLDGDPVIGYQTPRVATVRIPAPVEPVPP